MRARSRRPVRFELANVGSREFDLKDEEGPAAQIDRRGGQRLVHRQGEVAVAADAGLVAQR